MSTNLNVIFEFKTTAQEAEAKKMVWLEKLRAIEPNHMPIAVQDKKPQELHNWELDEIFEDQEVLVWFTDNSMYNVLVYENALLIWSFYRFYTLYRDMGFMEERRKEIKEITAIFGVTKGIYASDSGGFHPSSYFSARIEEWGDSYQSVIEHAKKENIPLIKYPAILPYEEFNNDSIQEVVWDDFLNLPLSQHPLFVMLRQCNF